MELCNQGTNRDAIEQGGKMRGGDPLLPLGTVVSGKSKKVTDGPIVEGKEIVRGYWLVSATSMEEAVELSEGCPISEDVGLVEVREIHEAGV